MLLKYFPEKSWKFLPQAVLQAISHVIHRVIDECSGIKFNDWITKFKQLIIGTFEIKHTIIEGWPSPNDTFNIMNFQQ